MNIAILRPFVNRTTAVMLLAAGAGLMAAWSAQKYISDKVADVEAQARVPQAERVVAAHNLAAGTRLQASDLAVRSFPATVVSSDSVLPQDYDTLEGGILQTALQAGDTFVDAHVKHQSYSAFSTQLIKGRRAITMPVDAINSVSGLLQTGDLIDLYVSFEYQRRHITAPLLQGVLVLATGTSTGNDDQDNPDPSEWSQSDLDTGYSTVTLDAAPEDAVKLVAARQGGTITAVLRNPQDAGASTKATRGDLATLLGVNRPPPTPPQRRASVLYGNQAIRSVPKLAAPRSGTPQATGVFDLPYSPALTSSWRYDQLAETLPTNDEMFMYDPDSVQLSTGQETQ